MTTTDRPILRTALPATAILLLLAVAAGPARASVIVQLLPVGGDVVATGSGTLDLSALAIDTPLGFAPGGLYPSDAAILLGPALASGVRVYSGVTVVPGPFGPGGAQSPTFGSFEVFGVSGAGFLWVPAGYVSGAPLSSASTYQGETLTSLGVTPGTYTWSWPADSFVLVVPEPSLAALAVAGGLGLGLGIRRR